MSADTSQADTHDNASAAEQAAIEPLRCSADGCDSAAAEVLYIAGMAGHTHDCARDAAILREHCAVVGSAPVVDGRCPWPCSPPRYHAVPRRLT